MSGSDNKRTNDSPKSLQDFSFQVGYIPGNNLLHQFVLDHSHSDHSFSPEYTDYLLLLMYDANVNELNDEGYSPLHLAVLKNDVVMVKSLLSCFKKRLDVNVSGTLGKTPLHVASENGNDQIVVELLRASKIQVTLLFMWHQERVMSL